MSAEDAAIGSRARRGAAAMTAADPIIQEKWSDAHQMAEMRLREPALTSRTAITAG